jgi:hypothetical protein
MSSSSTVWQSRPGRGKEKGEVNFKSKRRKAKEKRAEREESTKE